ncbi:hypothetical protein AB0H94_21150 [Streptomyces purpurascens]|uniref:hypothetical protein n=1 Tax=Streptomyces purpurascens TaxID=1924 RepID=UPI00340EC0AE
MSKSQHSTNREVAQAMRAMAKRTGENAPSVRGSRLMLAQVTAVLTGGKVEVDGDMDVKRLANYTPAVNDLVVLGDFGNGNWIVFGKVAS